MLYRPDVCNCTMPYVHRTVQAVCRTGPCLDSWSGRSYTSETPVMSANLSVRLPLRAFVHKYAHFLRRNKRGQRYFYWCPRIWFNSKCFDILLGTRAFNYLVNRFVLNNLDQNNFFMWYSTNFVATGNYLHSQYSVLIVHTYQGILHRQMYSIPYHCCAFII